MTRTKKNTTTRPAHAQRRRSGSYGEAENDGPFTPDGRDARQDAHQPRHAAQGEGPLTSALSGSSSPSSRTRARVEAAGAAPGGASRGHGRTTTKRTNVVSKSTDPSTWSQADWDYIDKVSAELGFEEAAEDDPIYSEGVTITLVGTRPSPVPPRLSPGVNTLDDPASADPACPYCGSTGHCPHLLPLVDAASGDVEGGTCWHYFQAELERRSARTDSDDGDVDDLEDEEDLRSLRDHLIDEIGVSATARTCPSPCAAQSRSLTSPGGGCRARC